ncbi:MAG: Copper amine oxidase N-terminal domain [Chthonomonadaceae bacterium]|nr:Copper amine oxidase N-terminal domain [Chthonomonadaceae bacterium]
MKRMACALALAAGTGLTLGVATHTALAQPNPATAVSGLKLSVVPLGSVNADTPVALDVNFRGGKVRNVEVYLDGNRIAKETLDTIDTHGVISFKLPASLLAEGSHEITIQAVDKDGSTASTTTRIHVNAPPQETIAHFLTPKRNAMVTDMAPIEVKLDDSIKDAYVMFFLDGQFLSARNYSPYVYGLDTSKYSNGDHTVKIEVWDSAGASVLKTLSMPLKIHNKVDNFTHIERETPDLNKPVKPSIPVADALSSLPNAVLDAKSPSAIARSGANARPSMGVRNGTEPRMGYTPFRSAFPVNGISVTGALSNDLNLLDPENDLVRMANGNGSAPHVNAIAPSATGIAIGDPRRPVRVTPQPVVNSTFPGILADPSDLNALNSEAAHVAHQSVSVRRAGNVAARPSTSLEGAPAPAAARPAHAVQVARTPRIHVGSRSMRNSHIKTFDVAFDNTQIAFDVPPRIENGMPLAPFRAIFEHSGGTVKWYGESKTVRAINNSKEIEIHIGDKEATVNNQKVHLDAKAYIDRGRTIVPLSFVRDAMDVKVTYDAHTGHVLIESNK